MDELPLITSPQCVLPNMAAFPTPPSSSGDSPTPLYFVASPNSNTFMVSSPESSQHYIQTHVLPSDTSMTTLSNGHGDNGRPYLRFVEQPTNKFRFRYKSEMAGTHGSLCGMNSDKTRKQTYPSVELMNFPADAVIRCSIYQWNVTEDFKPHPHRLIMKKGKEECDDPHEIEVGPNEGFIARFHSMGIIHTARKNIVGELVKKKSQLKRELVATLEGKIRQLTIKEITECDMKLYPSAELSSLPSAHEVGVMETEDPESDSDFEDPGDVVNEGRNVPSESYLSVFTCDQEFLTAFQIKGLAEQESKSINLNIVCLRFDAFLVKSGIRNPICPPIFSHGINNLKCALTGDLKIVRMDHCTSPARGGKEIFLLVERVTKKNIKIRFFEYDDEQDTEVWEGYGKFSELDVHHQYAIVFKTPAYDRDPNITRPVQVFMELVRPSDNAKSEPKEFRFVPNNEFKPGSKRPRCSMDTSSSYNSGSLSSSELPATIPNNNIVTTQDMSVSIPSANSWNHNELISDEHMRAAMMDYNSDEFKELYETFASLLPNEGAANAVDGHLSIADRLSYVHIGRCISNTLPYDGVRGDRKNLRNSEVFDHQMGPAVVSQPVIVKAEVAQEDLRKAERTYKELKNFIKSLDAHERAPDVLEHHFGEGESRRNNALHVFISLNRKEEVTFILKMFVLSKKFELTNVPNADNQTPLNIAVQCCNEEFVTYLLHCRANPTKQDGQGRTALHIAIMCGAPLSIIKQLVKDQSKSFLDLEDYDGYSALNLAVEKQKMSAVKMLTLLGSDINKKHPKNGYTPLRIAVENQFVEAIKFILKHNQFNMEEQHDFQGLSPFQVANVKQPSEEIVNILNRYLQEKGASLEMKREIEDDEEEEEMEEDVEMKPESEWSLQQPPDVIYSGLRTLPEYCLEEVSAVLDESGKYEHLADLLDLGHLLQAGIISSERSVSRNLLQYAIERDNVNILVIRNFLENLDEHKAVAIMDRAAVRLSAENQ